MDGVRQFFEDWVRGKRRDDEPITCAMTYIRDVQGTFAENQKITAVRKVFQVKKYN